MKRLISRISFIVAFLFACTLLNAQTDASKQKNTAIIKVMTYNIHHANPPSRDSLIDMDAIVRVIQAQDPDLLLLQEVDQGTQRSGGIDQAAVIAKRLSMHYFFAKAIDYDGGAYGQAVLSKFPIDSARVAQLPAVPDFTGEQRIMAVATIALNDDQQVLLVSTHLDAQKVEENRVLQAHALKSFAMEAKLPILLAGDFNAVETSAPLQILQEVFHKTCTGCAFTIPVINPKKAIDFILFDKKSNWTLLSHQVVNETYASDHLPVVSVVELKK